MVISPEEVRQHGNLEIDPIPLNHYQPDITAERERWGEKAMIGAYRDMVLIRQFERMLESIKSTGSYAGLDYVHERRGDVMCTLAQLSTVTMQQVMTHQGF